MGLTTTPLMLVSTGWGTLQDWWLISGSHSLELVTIQQCFVSSKRQVKWVNEIAQVLVEWWSTVSSIHSCHSPWVM